MSKLKLFNGVTYLVEDYATPNRFVIILDSLTSAEVLENLTEGNLSKIQFLTDSGAVTGTYYNKLLCGYTDNGGTLAVSINDADLCRYGLVLDENNRIIDAPVQRYAPADAIIVDKLPDGDYHDYLYVSGECVYDPLPKPSTYPVAPRNITEGEYITIGGVLYKAIANIPNGEPVIEGKNAIETTVEAQLYELTMKGE